MASIQGGTNPFYTEGEDDDFGFGKTRDPYDSRKDPFAESAGDEDTTRPLSRYEQLQQQKQASMSRQLQGTQRALASIYDSEQIGVATAEELVRQGEQLDNVDNNLDKINSDMKTSQRHLNSIKSVFGSVKNWWAGKDKAKEEAATAQPTSKEREPSKLQKTLEESEKKAGPHPAYRLQGVQGFYEDEKLDELDSQFLGGGSSSTRANPSSSRGGGYSSHSQTASSRGQQQTLKSGFGEYDKQFDDNLDMMSSGMAKLKCLAQGLGDEIESQNDQLDRIDLKTDKADTRLRDQNRQMRHILKK